MVLPAKAAALRLGNERLMEEYHHLIAGKKVGLVTNQSGVNTRGESTIDVLVRDASVRLVALYGPEHGIDGTAKAGEYVESWVHPTLDIPVYSLYGPTRMPTAEMLRDIDVLLFDIQDIGARTYTYMSTLNYCMVAAEKHNKPIVILDRPNPVGGVIVEGPVLEEPFKSFVGVDNLPMAHGMTAGELGLFFNRRIGADLTVVPMEGWTRDMIYQDTGLPWVQTSPNIPDLEAVFGYMATGLGEGTGILQADKFRWIGGTGVDARKFADLLNQAGLPGVTFIPETRDAAGGVRLNIVDYRTFNPARTGIYALAYARTLNGFKVPKSSGQNIVMFDKIMGTDKIGQYLEQGLSPAEIEARYAPALNRFKAEREKYLIYGYEPGKPYTPGAIQVLVDGRPVAFDVAPYIDANSRVMVPLRAIVEALGAQVDWDAGTKRITITGAGKKSLFTVGSTTAVFNGTTVTLDTCPVIKNGRTMVPARFTAESVGARVLWDGGTRTVTIVRP
jgi:uncharacterized protein YbbC (DUF1343 family)